MNEEFRSSLPKTFELDFQNASKDLQYYSTYGAIPQEFSTIRLLNFDPTKSFNIIKQLPKVINYLFLDFIDNIEKKNMLNGAREAVRVVM